MVLNSRYMSTDEKNVAVDELDDLQESAAYRL